MTARDLLNIALTCNDRGKALDPASLCSKNRVLKWDLMIGDCLLWLSSPVPRGALVRVRRLLLVIVLTTATWSCDSGIDVSNDAWKSGWVRSVTRIGYYPALVSRLLVWRADLADALPVEHGVVVYRVEYWTTGPAGERTHASGLIAVPRVERLRGVVSYQPPTTTHRDNVPSSPSATGLLAAIAFAGHGYLLAAPDYMGLGTSPGSHPYLHAETEARAVIDLLQAARAFVRHQGHVWPEALFLTGFSQGGHASLAAQRQLEAEPVEGMQITASAPIAGIYNLSGIQFPAALEGTSGNHSTYLGYIVSAYARLYGEPLASVVSEPYAERFAILFDGTKSMPEVAAILPRNPRNMLTPGFILAIATGNETWLTRAMAENDVFDWAPKAPTRFYYGSGDKDSPPSDTRFTVQHMQKRGGQVSSVDLGDKDHNAVAFAAVPQVRTWFDNFSASRPEGK